MTPASPLVALTIWTALILYVAGEYGRTRRPAAAWARPIWLLGAVVYLAHVASAFDTHHGWSHAAAYAYTAAQTEALVGLRWGGGLWVNYAFTAIWAGEGVWFLFMIANGAFVFVSGSRRALGIAIMTTLVWIWWEDRRIAGGSG